MSYVAMDDDQDRPRGGDGDGGGSSSGAPVAHRARDISASLQAGASRWLKSTKDWIADKTQGGAAGGREQLLAAQQAERHHRWQAQPDDYDGSPSAGRDAAGGTVRIRGPRVQRKVPAVLGAIALTGTTHLEDVGLRDMYQAISVHVPPGAQAGQDFVVALPTGEARLVPVPKPRDGQRREVHPGARLSIPFKGYIPESFGMEYRDPTEEGDEESAAQADDPRPSRLRPDERLLDFYRRHNPAERDALLEKGEHGFGLAVFDGEFGVHVHHAAFIGVQTMLAADDVIMSVNGEPVQCLREFREAIAAVEVGGFVSLCILRRSPPPVQRCPADHALQVVGPQDALPLGSECNRCSKPLWNEVRVHRCAECDWALCNACHASAFEMMNTERNANRGDPEWANDYEEDLSASLTFSSFDKGTKIRIFWQTTGEWWLGEIVGYHPERGHDILYEEGEGDNKQLSKQTIRDLSKHTFRVMRKRPETAAKLQPPGSNAAPPVEDLLGADYQEAGEPNAGAAWQAQAPQSQPPREEFVLTADEQSLLDGIEADLGSHQAPPAAGSASQSERAADHVPPEPLLVAGEEASTTAPEIDLLGPSNAAASASDGALDASYDQGGASEDLLGSNHEASGDVDGDSNGDRDLLGAGSGVREEVSEDLLGPADRPDVDLLGADHGEDGDEDLLGASLSLGAGEDCVADSSTGDAQATAAELAEAAKGESENSAAPTAAQ